MSDPVQSWLELARGHWAAAALATAVELDLFGALDGPPRSVAEIAAAVQASERGVRSLLVGLSGLGLVEDSGGRWTASEPARRHLSRRSPEWRGAPLLMTARSLRRWAQLTDSVRTGLPVASEPSGGDRVDGRELALSLFHSKQREADGIVGVLPLDGVRRVADLGGGAGTLAAALLRRDATLRVTLVDRAEPLAVARELHPPEWLDDRLILREADFMNEAVGGDYDLVLLGSVFHLFGGDDARRLLDRAHACLRPGGRIAMRDFFVADATAPSAFVGLFDLNMLLNTETGRTYGADETRSLLEAAGFVEPRQLDIDGGAASWMVARRPDDQEESS